VYRNRSPLPWSPDTGVLLGLWSGLVLSVWFFSFAANTYFWRYFDVNNVLIFEFDPRNHLNFQQLFAVASFMGIIWSSGLLFFLFADWLHIPYYVGPVSTWVVWPVLFSLPVPFLYWRSRWWLFKEMVSDEWAMWLL
uniref:EXS domain-containing protein n=1 Tax=Amphimedon queenslandica TaxID=400682 RepID=A0A1X7TB84_AMPQE